MYSVYKITNNVNGKIYIGYTSQGVRRRFKKHLSDAFSRMCCAHLHKAIRKYGPDSFRVETLHVFADQQSAFDMESQLIKELKTQDTSIGYNIADGGKGGVTPEMAKKISKAIKGRKLSKEHVAKLPQNQKGFKPNLSEETRRKFAENSRNRIVKDETREKCRLINLGKETSPETRAKIREARLGKSYPAYEIECPHCGKTGSSRIMGRWHLDNCKHNPELSVSERSSLIEEGKRNIKNAIERYAELSRSGEVKRAKRVYKKATCPHCNKEGAGGNMTRYHFDNCKLKEVV